MARCHPRQHDDVAGERQRARHGEQITRLQGEVLAHRQQCQTCKRQRRAGNDPVADGAAGDHGHDEGREDHVETGDQPGVGGGGTGQAQGLQGITGEQEHAGSDPVPPQPRRPRPDQGQKDGTADQESPTDKGQGGEGGDGLLDHDERGPE